MANRIETLRSLALQSGHKDLAVLNPKSSTGPLNMRGSAPYTAGASSRRTLGWNASRLGQNTLLITNSDQMRARSRESVRNDAWAKSAIRRFKANVVGTGIQPHWQHPNRALKDQIQKAWNRWVRQADYLGQNNFYTLQSIVASELFETGECFVRYQNRPASERLFVPLQLQLIESEQLPVYYNSIPSTGSNNAIRAGIEMDADKRRIAYHFYKEHPGEAMLYPADAMTYIQIPAKQIRHVYEPMRAGQLRGEPRMVSVLALLYELEQYEDAAVVKKKIQTMFAFFITQTDPDNQVLPKDPQVSGGTSGTELTSGGSSTPMPPIDPGVEFNKIETGTAQTLLPGENIVFPQLPSENDFAEFMKWALHKFSAGIGMTFEQITGNLEGVNYSSIRSGMLEFRRDCEQFQANVMVDQFCDPIMRRWMDDAVLSGALDLPGYLKDPEQYMDVIWVAPGWAWVDPLKESQAALTDVRAGFESRSMIIRSRGGDPDVVDSQQAEERKRANDLGLTYDSDPDKVLLRGSASPDVIAEAETNQSTEDESTEGRAGSGGAKGKPLQIAARRGGSGVG